MTRVWKRKGKSIATEEVNIIIKPNQKHMIRNMYMIRLIIREDKAALFETVNCK